MSAAIGAMRHRVVIEAAQPVPDGGGGQVVTWSAIGEVWAAVRPLSAGEGAEADGIQGRITHEVTMRWRTDVSPRVRLRLGARVFDVKGVIDREETHRFLTCHVEERTG